MFSVMRKSEGRDGDFVTRQRLFFIANPTSTRQRCRTNASSAKLGGLVNRWAPPKLVQRFCRTINEDSDSRFQRVILE